MNTYGFKLIQETMVCKHLAARLESGRYAELIVWNPHADEVEGRWEAKQLGTTSTTFRRLRSQGDYVVYHAVLPTGEYVHLHVWKKEIQPRHVVPTTDALVYRGGWALRPEYVQVEVLHHACGVGQIPTIQLSDEEAWQHAARAYQFWSKTAAQNGGWEVKGLTIWFGWTGGGWDSWGARGTVSGVRDSCYDTSGQVNFVLDTWHDHCGESCSEGHSFPVKQLPFDKKRLSQLQEVHE